MNISFDPSSAFDKEGYLKNLSDWDKTMAQQIALAESIKLSAEHWQVIYFLREFYQQYGVVPAMRVLVKITKEHLGQNKGNSRYLYRLFPGGPAKQACKIAGLPKPSACI